MTLISDISTGSSGNHLPRCLRIAARCFATSCLLFGSLSAGAEEQDAVSKAMDSTATQWSFQFAYQNNADFRGGNLPNGSPRPEGLTDYIQLRAVAPFVFETFTLLPRLTVRHYENAQGESGLGNTELFGLIIPKSWDWGTGRVGIGPLITAPGNKNVAKDEWGYGFAAAAVNTSGKWFYGLLFTQSWQSVDPNLQPVPPGSGNPMPGSRSNRNPLGIAPFLNYQLGDGWYVGNGDMVVQYDWNAKEWYVPLGVRLGKVLASKSSGSWNLYGEYQTSVVYDDWPGSAVKSSYRINLTRTIPVGGL